MHAAPAVSHLSADDAFARYLNRSIERITVPVSDCTVTPKLRSHDLRQAARSHPLSMHPAGLIRCPLGLKVHPALTDGAILQRGPLE